MRVRPTKRRRIHGMSLFIVILNNFMYLLYRGTNPTIKLKCRLPALLCRAGVFTGIFWSLGSEYESKAKELSGFNFLSTKKARKNRRIECSLFFTVCRFDYKSLKIKNFKLYKPTINHFNPSNIIWNVARKYQQIQENNREKYSLNRTNHLINGC